MIAIDIDQFSHDPFGSGVQRVAQQLARHWPRDVAAEFVMSFEGSLVALPPEAAHRVLSLPFERRLADHEAPSKVAKVIAQVERRVLSRRDISTRYETWLIPEVVYDPQVLARLSEIANASRMTMVAFDALPMSNPENYLFTPGTYDCVSRYFQLVRDADALLCISDFSRGQIHDVLRRSPRALTSVCHPGGDHVEAQQQSNGPDRPLFVRLGTLEDRKRPVEIVSTFEKAIDQGLEADLAFIGSPSRVDLRLNNRVTKSIESGYPVTWERNAEDSTVRSVISRASVFLSIGIEGYGIPSLESLRAGTPVAFSGIQPAAELMEGLGAIRISTNDFDEIHSSSWHELVGVAETPPRIELHRIPLWEAFTRRVIDHL